MTRRTLLPFVLTYMIFNLLFVFHVFPAEWKMDDRVLLIGNGLLFMVTFVSFILHIKGLRNDNAQIFVRTMYGSLLVKMLICIVAILVYAVLAGRGVNRNGVIACFVLYLFYTFLEVRILQRLYKQKPKNV